MMLTAAQLQDLQTAFGDSFQTDVELAPFTSARMGGNGDAVLTARSVDDLVQMANFCREHQHPFLVLGGGSNVLISDRGIREVVILNKANKISFLEDDDGPYLQAESGANFGKAARMAGSKSLSGLEWACGIPGTVGGAVVGNAGAHGGEIAAQIILAEILHADGSQTTWELEDFEYQYRNSIIKRNPAAFIVLSAALRLKHGERDVIKAAMDRFLKYRKKTQPPGASMGSIFKNPPGYHSGRLIEEAGLKGTRVGGAEISSQHGNFFINHENATAADMKALIDLAAARVLEHSGVALKTEICMIGDWGQETVGKCDE